MDDQMSTDAGPGGAGGGTAAKMKQDFVDKAKGLKDTVTEFGKHAADNIDAQREPAAAALQKTATTLHQQGDKASTLAHATADKLQSTAEYVRENDLKAMAGDVGDLVKRYPGQALAAAVIVGFLVGRVFQSND